MHASRWFAGRHGRRYPVHGFRRNLHPRLFDCPWVTHLSGNPGGFGSNHSSETEVFPVIGERASVDGSAGKNNQPGRIPGTASDGIVWANGVKGVSQPGSFDYRNVAAKSELATALVHTATRSPRCARNDIRGQSKDPVSQPTLVDNDRPDP